MTGHLLKFKQRYSVKIGGRRYPVVKIGNQLWMAENLDYKFSYNGNQIPIGVSGSPSTPAAWYYNNDESIYGIDGTYKCGLMYNWYAVKYLDDNKTTLLPEGWHVPTLMEFNTLATAVGGSSVAGTKLKARDSSITSNWPSEWGGTDDYEFTGLPTGTYYNAFYNLNVRGYFWTLTELNSDNSYTMRMVNSETSVDFPTYIKVTGYSLRLVKDAT